MGISTYNLTKVAMSFGAIDLAKGQAAEGDVAVIEYAEDRVTVQTSPDGNVTYNLKEAASRTATLTIRCAQTSPVNALLSAVLVAADLNDSVGAAPFALKNTAGASVFFCPAAAIQKRPGEKFGQEAQPIEWKFICPNSSSVVGGA